MGYEYEEVYDYTTGNLTFDIRPSNWRNRTTNDPWTYEGVYTGSPITTIHFDNGDENIHADVTEFINTLITGTTTITGTTITGTTITGITGTTGTTITGITITGTTIINTTNYGMGVSFDPSYMLVTNAIDQSVAFFTKYTQTFWEPYLETVFDDGIDDNRENFFIDVPRKLYLYVDHMGNRFDLDELPVVDIMSGATGPTIATLSGLTATKIRKGVYQVTFGLTGQLCDGKRFYYDKWCNLKVSGATFSCVTQKFIPKPFAAFFDIGSNNTDVDRYAIQFFGVKLNEKIKRGSTRKVVVTFRSINDPKSVLLDEVYYRIFVKEGKTQVNVFEWTKLDRTNENSFILDTAYMVPREYNIEIKARINSEDVFYRDEIKIEIISES